MAPPTSMLRFHAIFRSGIRTVGHRIRLVSGLPGQAERARARDFLGHRTKRPGLEGAGRSCHRFHGAGYEGSLHLGDGVVDRHARAFVQKLDAEDPGRAHRAVFVSADERDVEGKNLIGVPGCGQLAGRARARDGLRIERIKSLMVDEIVGPMSRVSEDWKTAEPFETSVYWGRISSASATKVPRAFSKEIQQGMSVKVDPYQGTCDAALVA
jgi:hypothetical protein